jgi:menaquinone-dependent protoporphyrinogen oxidase
MRAVLPARLRRVPVFYATSEGHTRQVAAVIAATLREQGFDSECVEVSPGMRSPDWISIAGAVVGASLHGGRHQHAATEFVRREHPHLAVRPSAFFSVSLSAGSRNLSEVDAARAIAARFGQNAGWVPQRLACFAGKLAYTKYGFLKRRMMRRIAAREGGPTDMSRDHVLTNWDDVRTFALGVAADIRARSIVRQAS